MIRAKTDGYEPAPDTSGERIRTEIEGRIAYFAKYPEKIGPRLAELAEEWTIERILETNTALLALAGVALSLVRGEKRWLALPALAAGVLLQYSLRGETPPVRWLRRLGVRHAREVEHERYALQILRGDYGDDAETFGEPSVPAGGPAVG